MTVIRMLEWFGAAEACLLHSVSPVDPRGVEPWQLILTQIMTMMIINLLLYSLSVTRGPAEHLDDGVVDV